MVRPKEKAALGGLRSLPVGIDPIDMVLVSVLTNQSEIGFGRVLLEHPNYFACLESVSQRSQGDGRDLHGHAHSLPRNRPMPHSLPEIQSGTGDTFIPGSIQSG